MEVRLLSFFIVVGVVILACNHAINSFCKFRFFAAIVKITKATNDIRQAETAWSRKGRGRKCRKNVIPAKAYPRRASL
jgi:hypothetical protein